MPFLAIQVVWAPGSEMSVAWNDYLKVSPCSRPKFPLIEWGLSG